MPVHDAYCTHAANPGGNLYTVPISQVNHLLLNRELVSWIIFQVPSIKFQQVQPHFPRCRWQQSEREEFHHIPLWYSYSSHFPVIYTQSPRILEWNWVITVSSTSCAITVIRNGTMLCRKKWTWTIRKALGMSDAAITRCAVIMYESVRGRLNDTPDMGDVVYSLIDQMNSVETQREIQNISV